MSQPFLSQVTMYAFDFAPTGWAACDGTILPVSQHSSLYGLIFNTFGGTHGISFALPNLQGRVVMGAGYDNPHTGQPIDPREYSLGETGGATNVTLTTDTLGTHSHEFCATSKEANSVANKQGSLLAYSNDTYLTPAYTDTGSLTQLNQETISNTGEGQSHSNVQPYLSISYCIAISGVWPERN